MELSRQFVAAATGSSDKIKKCWLKSTKTFAKPDVAKAKSARASAKGKAQADSANQRRQKPAASKPDDLCLTTASSRTTEFLDDVWNAVASTLEGIDTGACLDRSIDRMCLRAMQFALLGKWEYIRRAFVLERPADAAEPLKTTFVPKEAKKVFIQWPNLRLFLKQVLAYEHAMVFAPTLGAASSVDDIVASDAIAHGGTSPYDALMLIYSTDPLLVANLKNYLDQNNMESISNAQRLRKTHHALADGTKALWKAYDANDAWRVALTDGDLNNVISLVVDIIADVMFTFCAPCHI